VSHWVAYGIPVSVTGFAEGEVSKHTDKFVGGKSRMGLPHYFGPCTPAPRVWCRTQRDEAQVDHPLTPTPHPKGVNSNASGRISSSSGRNGHCMRSIWLEVRTAGFE
jgi:phosphatidylethanolamine-binding protein (PEBP) family uncharacterized protein